MPPVSGRETSGPTLPEGFEIEPESSHGAPTSVESTLTPEVQADQAEETRIRHATATRLQQENIERPRTLLPIATSMLAPELLPEAVTGIALGGPTTTALARGAVRAGAFAGGLEAGKAAAGEPVSVGDAAENLAFGLAFEGVGAVPTALHEAVAASPAAQAMLDRVTAVGGRLTGATAKAATGVTDFFKALGANPAELEDARLSTAKGKELGEQAYSVFNDHRIKLQGELKSALGSAANASVPRNVVDDPLTAIMKRVDETGQKQNLSARMSNFISRFSAPEAEDGTGAAAASKLADTAKRLSLDGQSNEDIEAGLKGLGATPAEVKAAMQKLKPFDYTKSFDDADFYHQPSYSIDELTSIRSKLHSSVQTGNAYDRMVNDFVSKSLGNDIDRQITEHDGSLNDVQAVHDFFEQKWPELKNLQDAFDLGARGQSGIAQADQMLSVAKNQPYLFERYLDWAGDLQRTNPSSNVMPAMREAFMLRLSRASDLADTPEAARDEIAKAINEVPFRVRSKMFGPGTVVTDAKKLASVMGSFKNPSAMKQIAATAGRRAGQGWWFLSRYMTGRILYAVGKDMGWGGHDKSTSPFTAKKADLPLLAGSFAAAFFGPSMFRAVMSYAGAPVQRAYVEWLTKPSDAAALSRFGRVLGTAVGAGEGAVAGSGSGHPYLGAAIGATLRSIGGIPGVTDGKLLEPTEPPPGAPPIPETPAGPRPFSGGPKGTPLTNRGQGFQMVGAPQTGTPPAEPQPVPTPVQLPAVQQDDPMNALKFLKNKSAKPPSFSRLRPPMTDALQANARPALPGGFAGPEGGGQFVTRGTPRDEAVTPVAVPPAGPAPSGAGAAPAAPQSESAPQSGLFSGPQREPNADFRKMRLATDPQVFTEPASMLERNPQRWQFKESNQEGLTGALSGVEHYDKVQSGELIAYYDPNSEKMEVVDGHQRHHAALHDNDAQVPFYVLDGGHNFKGALAHDVTPEAARAFAAVRNLRAGTGTSLDVAKFVRDAGLKVDDLRALNVPLSGSQVRDGMALSNLDDGVFREVALHRFPERLGIVMGTELADRPEVQMSVLKDLRAAEAKGDEVSPADLQEWIKMAKGSETQQMSMTDLFGERKTAGTNYKEMGQLSKFMINDLRKDTSAFRYAGRNAERLAKGNTIVDVDTGTKLSADAANRLMMYRRVAYEPEAETNKLLKKAAWDLKGAKTPAQKKVIQSQLYKAVSAVLPSDFDKAVSEARGITPASAAP